MDEKKSTFSGVIVTPARMEIPTMPGRPMRPLGKSTVLGQWVKRARLAAPDVRLIITTSNSESDRPVLEYCLDAGIPCLIDSTENPPSHLAEVLGSLDCHAAAFCSLSNPFIEPSLLHAAFAHCAETDAEYVTYSGLPAGSAIEVLARHAFLEFVQGERHGQPYTASVLPVPPHYFAPGLSFPCETEADYARLLALYLELLPNADGILGLDDVIASVQEAEPLRRAA